MKQTMIEKLIKRVNEELEEVKQNERIYKKSFAELNVRIIMESNEWVELISELEATQWINVKDRLPEESDWYDVVIDSPIKRIVVICSYDERGWIGADDLPEELTNRIIFWKPRPQPPEEEK